MKEERIYFFLGAFFLLNRQLIISKNTAKFIFEQ